MSVTKFEIVIGSPRAYLLRNRCAITYVYCRYSLTSNNFFKLIPVIAGLPTILKLMESATDLFAQKKFSKYFLIIQAKLLPFKALFTVFIVMDLFLKMKFRPKESTLITVNSSVNHNIYIN